MRPLSLQQQNESHRLWQPVTEAIHQKQFTKATKAKQVIEQEQRDKAASRAKSGEVFKPVLFDEELRLSNDDGRPHLSQEGRRVLQLELDGAGYSATGLDLES